MKRLLKMEGQSGQWKCFKGVLAKINVVQIKFSLPLFLCETIITEERIYKTQNLYVSEIKK